ncbi:hypothetical protein BT69DRAFT_1292707, partial [Atractiella rhizophila]
MSAKQVQKLVDKLLKKPYDYAAHISHIQLVQNAVPRDGKALQDAREMMSKVFPLPEEDMWTAWLQEEQDAYKQSRTHEALGSLVELYQRASQDVLSIPIHENFARLLINEYYQAHGIVPRSLEDTEEEGMDVEPLAAAEGEASMKDFISDDLVRGVMDVILDRVGWHLTESHKVWDQWRDWEMQLLLNIEFSPGELAREKFTTHPTHPAVISCSIGYSTF